MKILPPSAVSFSLQRTRDFFVLRACSCQRVLRAARRTSVCSVVSALLFVISTHDACAQNFYWKDNAINGRWDWGGSQWYSSSGNNFVGAPASDGSAIIWFENVGGTNTFINAGFTGGWFKLNSLYTAANSTGRRYSVNVENGGTGIEVYNKIETISGGGALAINAATQLGANSEINAVGGSLTLGELRMNGKTLSSFGANSLNITGVISGTGAYNIKNQGITVTYSGSGTNTFSGTTTVENSSTLVLNKSANTAALAGSLIVNSGATVRTDSAGQLGNQFVTVNGTLNLNGNNQSLALAGTSNSASVALGSATMTVTNTGSDSFAGVISGSGGITKSGIGRLSLSGSSSYNGATAVSAGDLNLSGGSITNSAVTVASGASLSGYGSVGTIGGAGAINPGNSPGILTTPQVNPSGETDFNLEMTGTAPTYNNAASSVNDVIRITGGTPFSQALAAGNGINIYFSGAALFTGSTAVQYQGGFFTDRSASFASSISSATYTYYFANASGTNSYNGVSYYTKAQYETAVLSSNLMTITVTTVAQTANFGGGDINGQVMQVQVIPEPSTYALLGLSAVAFGAYRWRRRRRG